MKNIPAIEFHRASVRVGEKSIVDDYSALVSRGERVLLSGPSGSGKSTLLNCILGFARLTSGDVSIFSEKLSSKNVWTLRTKLSLVPQEPHLGEGSVEEILLSAFCFRANAELPNPEKRIPKLMDLFQLESATLQSPIHTLSGGEKQRVAIIAALLLNREILLLDEPSSALDTNSRKAIISALDKEAPETVLVVSHDDDWKNWADRTLPNPSSKMREAS